MAKMGVKIYGLGWVGRAMKSVFPDAIVHDPDLGYESKETADVAFIAVPTPNAEDGSLDTSIVEMVVESAQEDLIVVRSTVNPGDCDRWEKKYGKNIVFQPEYLGETMAHPLFNEGDRPFLIIGGRPENRRKLIELYWSIYNANINIRQTTLLEAEVIKLSENRAIMFKVMQCQELYDACERKGVDYYTVRDAVYGDDPRFNLWFTAIYPEARGANSKCIPKDIYAWAKWAGVPALTGELLNYNERLLDVVRRNSK